MAGPDKEAREPSPIRQGLVSRLGEFAVYAAMAGAGTLVILWLLANTK